MKRRVIQSTVAVTAAIAALSIAGPASAQHGSEAGGFGHHVAECAQTMGFDGTHNPGMHRGASGWDGTECEQG